MSSFKGTKGNWILRQFPEGQMSVRNIEDTRKICVGRVQNYEESGANLLLISKAPEMLEMLERLSNTIYHLDKSSLSVGVQDRLSKVVHEAKQLIKEATTI